MVTCRQIKTTLIAIVLLCCLCMVGFGRGAGEYTTLPAYVNGRLEFTAYDREGVLYLPLRSFCGSLQLGAVVSWQESTGTMTVQFSGNSLTARVGDIYLYINDRIVYLTQPIRSHRGNLLVPATGLCDAFGVTAEGEDSLLLDTAHMALCAPGSSVYDPVDLKWLSHIIHAEAGNQSLEGQICVGNVVLNRVADSRFPDTVADVVFSPNQFCPVKSGSIYCTPDADAVAAAKLCLEGVNLAGQSLYFVNPTTGVDSWFRKNLTYAMTVGAHDFYY